MQPRSVANGQPRARATPTTLGTIPLSVPRIYGKAKLVFKRNYNRKKKTTIANRVVFVIGCVSCNKFSHFRQKSRKAYFNRFYIRAIEPTPPQTFCRSK
jgi:hypothetical protein